MTHENKIRCYHFEDMVSIVRPKKKIVSRSRYVRVDLKRVCILRPEKIHPEHVFKNPSYSCNLLLTGTPCLNVLFVC